MNKLFSVLTILIFLLLNNLAFAGDDGKIEINGKKNGYVETNDCFEKVNRGIFAFNQGIDKIIFKPLAKGYRIFPQPIRSGTSNALTNLSSVVTVPNNLLQGKFKDAGVNSARFIINSTLGIGGIFDVWIEDYFYVLYEFFGETTLEAIGVLIWTCFVTVVWDTMRGNRSIFDEDATF